MECVMGASKNAEEKEYGRRAAGWDHVARSRGYECLRCGNTPQYDEREIYFEMGLCGWCAHQSAKDD